jgi:hypothetical protein
MTANQASPIGAPSLIQLLFGIVDRPKSTFEAVAARRGKRMWAIPLSIGLVCLGVMIVVQAPYNLELARQQAQRQLDTLPPDQAEAARAQVAAFVSLPVVLASGLGMGGIGMGVVLVAQSAVFYFGTLVLGGEVGFGAMVKMSAWSRLPQAVNSLVLAGFSALAGRGIQYTGLAPLVATGDIARDGRNPLVALLGTIDLFWLWHLLLVVVGLSAVAHLSRSKSVVLTAMYVALTLAVAAVPTLLFRGAA